MYDAINAALNLSGARIAQVPIAKAGLWTLVELWYASQMFSWEGELQAIGEMAGETLTNLATNEGNRTVMYRAELKLKSVKARERESERQAVEQTELSKQIDQAIAQRGSAMDNDDSDSD